MDLRKAIHAAASVLRRVRDASVSVSVPLQPGSLAPGLAVEEGTVARVSVRVRGGEIDLKSAALDLMPPLHGPLFTAVRGVELGSDGRVAVRLRGLPDLKVGPKLPSSVSELADALEQLTAEANPSADLALRVLGVKIGHLSTHGAESLLSARIDSPQSPGAPRLDQLRVESAEVTLADGPISLPEVGTVTFAEGTRFRIDGTGTALHVDADVTFTSAAAKVGTAWVEEARGAATLSLELDRDERGLPQLHVSIESALVDTGRAGARRANGDFAELLASSLSDLAGTVTLYLRAADSPLGPRLSWRELVLRADVARAAVERGRLTIPFGTQKVPVAFEQTTYRGRVNVLGTDVHAKGTATFHTQVGQLRTVDSAITADVEHLEAHGTAEIELDSQIGMHARSHDVEVNARLSSGGIRSAGDRMGALLGPGSRFDLKLREARLLRSGHFTFRGQGEVAFEIDSLRFMTEDIRCDGADATLQLESEIELNSREGVGVDRGLIRVHVGALSARLRHGEQWGVTLEGSNHFESTLSHARIALDRIVFFCDPGTRLTASAGHGVVSLPGGVQVQLRKRTLLDGRFSRLRLGTDAPPEATAALHLEARLGINDDAFQPTWWPLQLTRLTGVGETLEVDVERFTLLPTGRFGVEGVRIGMNAKAARIEGEAGEPEEHPSSP